MAKNDYRLAAQQNEDLVSMKRSTVTSGRGCQKTSRNVIRVTCKEHGLLGFEGKTMPQAEVFAGQHLESDHGIVAQTL